MERAPGAVWVDAVSNKSFGRQFQVVFEHSPIGIVIMEGSGRIQYANASVRSFLGKSEDELSGGFLTSFAHEEDSEFFQTLFAELIENERDEFQLVSRCKAAANALAWWRVDMRAVRDTESVPFILAVVDDVTSQKNDEQQLRRAKELAEAATRTKSAFLANMSHEIRTPLHTINGMAELLRETAMDEEQLEYLHQIQFAGEVLLGLINDILDFSKIEAGRLQLESIRHDPVRTIEDAVDMVSMQAHRKGLEMVLAVDHTLPRFIVGDPNRLRQVLVNLVNNAVKFTEKGYIKVSAARHQAQGVDQVLVQIKDTGIGIPEERRKHLFQPFSQVDASMTRKFGGTGLGLSISRDLIEMMHGKIGVKSRAGVGSNFWFTLPLTDATVETVEVLAPDEAGDGFRVLVVDDAQESASVLVGYLERWGFNVQVCRSAEDGIAQLTQSVVDSDIFDLALIDLRLPDMDGWQMASEIRNDPVLESIPLILMSPSGTSTGDAKMKLLRWFDAYINKPVKVHELASGISQVFASDIEELEALDVEAVGTGSATQLADSLPATVLVAEDHFVNQQLFQTILEKMGFRTLVASDGLEAVTMVQNHSDVGLIFMDVQMPNLNGYDATSRIRALGYGTPIIAVTANALSGDRDRCIRVGMDEYMSKPFKRGDIEEAIERLTLAGAFNRPTQPAGSSPVVDPEDEPPVEDVEDVEDEEDRGRESGDIRPTGDPIDIASAVEAFMGDAETSERVIRKFADRLPTQLEQLRQYLSEENLQDARVVAHAIKGGAWNLSAPMLGEAARTVEDACALGDRAAADAGLTPLNERIQQFRDYMAGFDFDKLA